MQFLQNLLFIILVSLGLMSAASAVPIDFTSITTVVDVTTVLAALAAIAALKFGVPFTKWAYHQVTSMFGGGK